MLRYAPRMIPNVAIGELTGDFAAFDARHGNLRYRFNTGGPVGGGIVTCAAGGRQQRS